MRPYLNDFFYNNNIDNYKIFLMISLLSALICFFILASKTKMQKDTFLFYLFVGTLSIMAGVICAFLFQSIYNYAESGVFVLSGMTVMGGILGAAIFFTSTTFLLSLTKFGRNHSPHFWTAVNLIVPCIVLAQFFGRIGCFLQGCCYGKETDSILGIDFSGKYASSEFEILHQNPRLPTQLFEAIFMLVLFAVMLLTIFILKKRTVTALIYAYSYSIFRFILEFFRDDYRGATLLGLYPSQVQSIALFLLAIAFSILIYKFKIIPFDKKQAFSSQKQQH